MIQHGKLHLLFQLEVHTNLDVSLHIHPGLSKIRSRAGGPGSDIINLGITIGGQKLGAGRFLIPRAGRGLTCRLPKFASAFKHVQRKQV